MGNSKTHISALTHPRGKEPRIFTHSSQPLIEDYVLGLLTMRAVCPFNVFREKNKSGQEMQMLELEVRYSSLKGCEHGNEASATLTL